MTERKATYSFVPAPELTDQQIIEQEAIQSAIQCKIDCDMVDQAAQALVSYEIQPAGMLMVERMLRYDPPNIKAVQVDAWVISVYVEAQSRKTKCKAGTWPVEEDKLDFSSFGEKPYDIDALMAEYVGAQ